MPEVQGQLAKFGSIVLDSNGNGTIDFDVDHAWQRWEVESVRVSTSQNSNQTPYPTAEVFAGPISPGFSQGASWTGNSDTFTGLVHVDVGNELHVQFTGGIPGTTAFARIYGKKFSGVDDG